jgi:hypothetical protein
LPLVIVTIMLTDYDAAMMATDPPTPPSAGTALRAEAPADPSPHPPARGGGATGRRPAPRLGPYSQLKQRLDKRTRIGQRAAALEQALTMQIGGAPSAAEAALIRLAVTLDARIELMRARLLSTDTADERAERQMLAWCNTLARTLHTLGLKAAPERPPSLAEIIAESEAHGG